VKGGDETWRSGARWRRSVEWKQTWADDEADGMGDFWEHEGETGLSFSELLLGCNPRRQQGILCTTFAL